MPERTKARRLSAVPCPAQAGKKAKVTVRDIARRMKVNVSTVSRALAGAPGVSPAKAEATRRLAEKLGYRPQPLRRKRTGAVGLIVGTDTPGAPDTEYTQRVIYWTERCAAERDLHVNVEFAPRRARKAMTSAIVESNRVDGVLLAGHLPAAFCRELVRVGVPAVAVNDSRVRTRCDCVIADVGPALEEALRRLLDLGHREFGLAISKREYPAVRTRYETYCRVLKEAGPGPGPPRVLEGLEFNLRGGRSAVQGFLETGGVPTAIVFENDWMALGAMYELARRGYTVPGDVSIVSHDNTAICEQVSPGLTSVDGAERGLLSLALDLLLRRIGGEDGRPQEVAVATRLVWRESCAPPGAGR